MYRKRYVNAVAEHDTKGSPLLTYSVVGTKEGSGDGSPPVGSSGIAPVVSEGFASRIQRQPVSYTHLTLPTIYSV